MTTPHRTLQMALDALDAITDDVDGTGLNTMPSFDKAIDAITALRAALAQPEPVASIRATADAMPYTHAEVKRFLSGISSDAAAYGLEVVDHMNGTMGLRAMLNFQMPDAAPTPPAAPVDGFGGNLDEAFERAPAVPAIAVPFPLTTQEIKDIARSTGHVTHDQAWEIAELLVGGVVSAAPAVPAECCRNELLTALHTLASNYENALGMFGQDGEGRRKAEGDLAHAMMVAAKHNRNGPGCAAPVVPSDDAAEILAGLFNCMPKEALNNDVPDKLAKRIGAFMFAAGYRMVFDRWYLQEPPAAPAVREPQEHIGWCRYVTAHEKATRLVLCDSDAPGAFRVYRGIGGGGK